MINFPVIWLTGNSGAGKTTLATGLQKYYNASAAGEHPLARRVIMLDGDDMRRTISTGESLSPADRRTHNLRVARLAALLKEQGFLVVVSVIAPFQSVRNEVDAVCAPVWVYLSRSGLDAPDRPYEPPANPRLRLDIDHLLPHETLHRLRAFIEKDMLGQRLIFEHGSLVIQRG